MSFTQILKEITILLSIVFLVVLPKLSAESPQTRNSLSPFHFNYLFSDNSHNHRKHIEQYFVLPLKARVEVNLEEGICFKTTSERRSRRGWVGCIKQRQVGRVKVIRRRILSDWDGTENKGRNRQALEGSWYHGSFQTLIRTDTGGTREEGGRWGTDRGGGGFLIVKSWLMLCNSCKYIHTYTHTHTTAPPTHTYTYLYVNAEPPAVCEDDRKDLSITSCCLLYACS